MDGYTPGFQTSVEGGLWVGTPQGPRRPPKETQIPLLHPPAKNTLKVCLSEEGLRKGRGSVEGGGPSPLGTDPPRRVSGRLPLLVRLDRVKQVEMVPAGVEGEQGPAVLRDP